ncbi:MAG TPA: Rieske (2Fe-2S) protein [Candidatus Binatia bacterium]|nr:Rieske (2Fe-2S) protein [Candidatus Binatia bacterium]
MTEADGLSRRRLINWLLSLGSGSLLGVLLYPIVRYVTPADQPEAAVGTAVVGQLRDFPLDSGKVVRFGERPAIVVRLAGGELRAFSAVCTHLGCTVQYRKDLELLWCPCHNGRFDLTGRNVAGPPPRPLEALEVAVRGDQVVVSRRA